MTESARPLLVVAVCTYRRNQPLRTLLEALAAQVSDAEPMAVAVSIVDDSPEGMARTVAAAFEGVFPGGLVYTNTASGNIATARNTAISSSLDLGANWIMFIDDDCVPSDAWITEMFAMQRRTGADLITGPVEDVAHPAAPTWLTEQPFLNQIPPYVDGEEPPYGTTANVLISASWLREHPEARFRNHLGRLGGEDMVWFSTCRDAGIVHRYALRAPVLEQVPLERSTYRWQLRRLLWFGNTMYVTNVESGEAPNRLFLRGVRRLVEGALHPLRQKRSGEPAQFRWALGRMAVGVGLMSGRFGVRLNHH